MKSLYLNENGDLEFNSLKELKMIDKEDEVRQRNELKISTAKGEWFLNILHGIDWNNLLGKQATRQDIEIAIIQALLEDDSIDTVDNIELDFDRPRRDLGVKFEATLIDGTKLKQEVEV